MLEGLFMVFSDAPLYILAGCFVLALCVPVGIYMFVRWVRGR